MLPEEKELTRLEAKQTKLQERVTAAELEFETLKIETARFRHRHYAAVGHLYAQLDEIEAKIANARAQLRPEDSTLKADARAANKRAKESAAEAGLMSANLKPTTAASPDLKQAYREAVKLVHPDLALSNHEQQRRTKLMAEINQAYELGDKGRIKKMIEEFGMDPEAITGQDIGSRIVRAIRRIAQLRRRLVEVQEEIRSQQKTEISQLREVVEKAELNGGDPLGDLQQKLKRQIFEHKCRFEGTMTK
jgi:predicted metalloendopeptidase